MSDPYELTQAEHEAIQAKISGIKSRRMRILKAIQYYLQTIKMERGYSTNITDVRMDAKSWRDVSAQECPVVFIIDDMVQITRNAGKNRMYIWTVKIFGVVKERSFEQFEEFIADVEQCMETNNHLAGTVSKAEVNQLITDNQMFDNTDTRLFEMDITCEYIRCLGNPK